MKNNRQVGLDGKIFVSTAIHRGAFFVFMLMLYGVINAVADLLKLTGASGVAMGAFTTTLLIYDFIVSLMLVVVVFYAYFLECGADVPILKEKPLMLFGYFRLGYYLLLSYYLCYRMLYCIANRDSVSVYIGIFYAVYLALVALLILANCYIFNTIARNIIRRSYEKSFYRLAIAGFIVQALMPVAYILARATMDDIGDEYFTTAVCDLLRLLVAPLLMTSLWFLFLHAVGQVHDVYGEVDSALKSKSYQITYMPENTGRKGRKKDQETAPAAPAVLLPAGFSAPSSSSPKALRSNTVERVAAPIAPFTAPSPVEAREEPSAAPAEPESAKEEVSAAVADAAETDTVTNTDAAEEAAAPAAEASVTEAADDEIIASFASEARKAVAKTAAQEQTEAARQQNTGKKKSPGGNQHPKNTQGKKAAAHLQAQPHIQPNLPVQSFDPYPSAAPHPQHQQPKGGYPNRNTGAANHARPAGAAPQQAGGARPNQSAQNGRQPSPNGARPQGTNRPPQQSNGARPVQNGSRQPQRGAQNQRGAQQRNQNSRQQPPKGGGGNNHR